MTRDVFLFWPVIFREDIEKVKGTNLENGRKRLLEKLIKRIKNVFFLIKLTLNFSTALWIYCISRKYV